MTIGIGGQDRKVKLGGTIKRSICDILLTLKEQRDRNTDEPVVVQRKDLMSRLSNTTNGNKKDLRNQIKIFTGWTSSRVEIDDGQFKYKIVYKLFFNH
jgi:hypothetical protein